MSSNYLWENIQDNLKSKNFVPAPIVQRVQATILEPGDAGGREPLGRLAGDDHGGPHAHVHIRGETLELLVQI